MRADRLLSLMLLLQAKGQMTAGQLAYELGVSERTIYRDINALSFAGIPLYTIEGRGGGIALEENYRVSLNSLNKDEVQALFVSGSVAPLGDLGLSTANETTLLKLLSALPSLQRAEAERVQQRIYIDPYNWFSSQQNSPFLPLIQEAVLSDAVLNIRYQRHNGEAFERTIQAYGLVAKSSVWYLVGAHEDKFRTYRVSRLIDVQSTGETFVSNPDFRLIDFWKSNSQSFIDSLSQYAVRLAIKASRQQSISNHPLFSGAEFIPTDDPNWLEYEILFDSEEQAISGLMSVICDIRIIAPVTLKTALLKYLREAVTWLESETHL